MKKILTLVFVTLIALGCDGKMMPMADAGPIPGDAGEPMVDAQTPVVQLPEPREPWYANVRWGLRHNGTEEVLNRGICGWQGGETCSGTPYLVSGSCEYQPDGSLRLELWQGDSYLSLNARTGGIYVREGDRYHYGPCTVEQGETRVVDGQTVTDGTFRCDLGLVHISGYAVTEPADFTVINCPSS